MLRRLFFLLILVVNVNAQTPDGKPASAPASAPAVDATTSHQAAVTSEPATQTGDSLAKVKNRLGWVVVLFVVWAALRFWIRRAKEKNRVKAVADFPPPPPPKKQNGMPVLSVPRRDKPTKPDPLKDGWSVELLREIEWHRFEHVVAAYERELGSDVELTDFGSDDCVDIRAFQKDTRTLKRIIQCKAFDNEPVGVEAVREFHATMKREKVPQGAFYTTNGFTEAALAMGKTEPRLELIDGLTFLNRIQKLHVPAQLHLFEVATESEYKTPTCPSCGLKMAKQSMGRGSHADSDFWGCRNIPRCKQTPIKRKQPA